MRILVVEDDEISAAFLKYGLEQEHYTIDIAADGEVGWAMSQTHDYDLIILDIMLPKRDGLTLCRQLRSQQRQTPILMLTGRQSIEDKVQGLDVGADDYLVKPFVFAELLARLRALLRRQPQAQATNLQVADLVLDIMRHQVYRNGQLIDLTVKEYAILEYLMRREGEVVTRAQLIEHAWDPHTKNASNVIDVYLSYLRRKIDRGFSPKLLHTVRGVGYVLRPDV
jgi:DNA-binding response OmpR family regulator